MTKSVPGQRFGPFYLAYLLALFFCINALNLGDRILLSVAVQPLKKEFGLNDTEIGLLTGITFAVLYAVAGIPLARWADRGVRKFLLSLTLAIWSGMTALTGLAQSYAMLLAIRIGVGVGEAGGIPTAQSLIADYFPPRNRAFAMGVLMAGGMFGTIVGLIGGGILTGRFGWRVAFLVMGLPGLVLAALALFTVREPRRGRFYHATVDPLSLGATLRAAYCNPTLMLLTIGGAIGGFPVYACLQWAPTFLIRSYGLSIPAASRAFGLSFGIATFFGTIAGGLIADRLAKISKKWRALVPALSYLAVVPCLLGAFATHREAAGLPLMAASGFLLAVPIGPLFALQVGVVPPAMRAMAGAIGMFATSIIGVGFGPLAIGMLSDALAPTLGRESLRQALVLGSVVPLVAGALFCLVVPRLSREAEDAQVPVGS